jgi:hypothetical protein
MARGVECHTLPRVVGCCMQGSRSKLTFFPFGTHFALASICLFTNIAKRTEFKMRKLPCVSVLASICFCGFGGGVGGLRLTVEGIASFLATSQSASAAPAP